jgi:hypothetical protein
MGWYPCCCGGSVTPDPCEHCTDLYYLVDVTLDGFSNAICGSCASLDATYTLTQQPTEGCCWTRTENLICSEGCNYQIELTLCAVILTPGTNKGWDLTIRIRTLNCYDPEIEDMARYRWNSGSTDDFDCTETHTLTLYLYTPDPSGPLCSGLNSLTVTVNP